MDAKSAGEYRTGLARALAAAVAKLQAKASPLDAVRGAIVRLEDHPRFNAGAISAWKQSPGSIHKEPDIAGPRCRGAPASRDADRVRRRRASRALRASADARILFPHEKPVAGVRRSYQSKQISGEPGRLLENMDPDENPKYYLISVAEGVEVVRAVNHPRFGSRRISSIRGSCTSRMCWDATRRHRQIQYENIYRKLAYLKYDRVVAMEFMPFGDEVTELRTACEQAVGFGSV